MRIDYNLGFYTIEADDGTWIPCDGRALSRSRYPELCKELKDQWGATPTTFTMPNLKHHPWPAKSNKEKQPDLGKPTRIIKVI